MYKPIYFVLENTNRLELQLMQCLWRCWWIKYDLWLERGIAIPHFDLFILAMLYWWEQIIKTTRTDLWTMPRMRGIIAFFAVLWNCGIAEEKTQTWFVPVTQKPVDSDKLFNVQTSTASQCMYVCIHNTRCLLIVYDDTESRCVGYKTQTGKEAVTADEKSWKIFSSGLLR